MRGDIQSLQRRIRRSKPRRKSLNTHIKRHTSKLRRKTLNQLRSPIQQRSPHPNPKGRKRLNQWRKRNQNLWSKRNLNLRNPNKKIPIRNLYPRNPTLPPRLLRNQPKSLIRSRNLRRRQASYPKPKLSSMLVIRGPKRCLKKRNRN